MFESGSLLGLLTALAGIVLLGLRHFWGKKKTPQELANEHWRKTQKEIRKRQNDIEKGKSSVELFGFPPLFGCFAELPLVSIND